MNLSGNIQKTEIILFTKNRAVNDFYDDDEEFLIGLWPCPTGRVSGSHLTRELKLETTHRYSYGMFEPNNSAATPGRWKNLGIKSSDVLLVLGGDYQTADSI